jgi:colicin import membrane protein
MNPAGEGGARPDRALPIFLSVLVHAAVVALLGWGWWNYRAPKPAPQQLAIEATVVIDKAQTPEPAVSAAAPAPPVPVPPVPVPPVPVPTLVPPAAQPSAPEPQQLQHEHDQRAADERAAHERELRAQRERAAAEARRKEQDAAARKAAEAAQRVAQEKARRETELRAQLAVEERVNAARGSAAAAEWLSLIRDRVTHAWIRPPSARPGVNCEVHVTQVPGGVVTGVQIGSCNGDAAVRESIEAAVYRASPLPSPTNPDAFDRNLTFTFHPDE